MDGDFPIGNAGTPWWWSVMCMLLCSIHGAVEDFPIVNAGWSSRMGGRRRREGPQAYLLLTYSHIPHPCQPDDDALSWFLGTSYYGKNPPKP